jgi:hypothetical protein
MSTAIMSTPATVILLVSDDHDLDLDRFLCDYCPNCDPPGAWEDRQVQMTPPRSVAWDRDRLRLTCRYRCPECRHEWRAQRPVAVTPCAA